MKPLKYLTVLAAALIAGGCNPDLNIGTVFEEPFIYIESEDGTRETRMADNVSDEKTYYIIMSSSEMDRAVEVSWEIVAGDGLVEGVDYDISPSSKNPVVINPGQYVTNMRIVWKRHAVDPAKDNSLKIVLTQNSENFTMGFPGPAQYNKQPTITKFNFQ
jgi:hypothetical protein